MKLLITGAAGFIGTNFCLYVKSKGHHVVALDNFSNPQSKQNLSLLKRYGICVEKIDIRKPLSGALPSVDVIVHLASHCSTSRSFKKPYEDFLDNALGTLNILEFAKNNGRIPMIYTSTIKVYPDTLNKLPVRETRTRYEFKTRKEISETYPIEPGSHAPYGCSKYVGDLYCQEYFISFGVPTVVNRLSTVFGPYQHGTEEAGWIYHFVNAAKHNKPITVYGSGKQVRDALWVEDLCQLFLKEITSIAKVKGAIYNVGGGKNNTLSILELINYLEKKTGKKMQVRFVPKRPGDLNVFISNISYAATQLQWKPRMGIWSGVDVLLKQI